MTRKIDLSALRDFLKTKNDADQFILMFDRVSAQLFKKNRLSLDKLLASATSYEIGKATEKIAKDMGINSKNRTIMTEFFAQLKELAASLPVVHMILALEPNEEVVNLIHNWFYNNFKKLVVLDITYDPELIGGSIVSFNGKANDYSLKSQMSLMRNREVL